MNGLTNIITKINEQTENSCSAIIEEAKAKAEEILRSAENDADALTREVVNNANSKCEIVASKAISSSLLEYKRVILAKKSEIIDGVVKEALNKLCSADEGVYFGYVESLIKKYATDCQGKIVFNSRDLKRLPAGFGEKLSTLVSGNGSLKVSDIAGDFDGGFIIEYPEMKIDCTFSTLVEDNLDDIRDEVSKVIFA